MRTARKGTFFRIIVIFVSQGRMCRSPFYKTKLTQMDDIFVYDRGLPISRIAFGHDISGLADVLNTCANTRLPVFMVADANVEQTADEIIASVISGAACRGNMDFRGKYILHASEENKTMSAVMSIAEWLLVNGADRNALVMAVGGGITTDMAGFAASIYKRGVRFAFVPTTLLSQVDASIGGKTGVNFDSYKNMLGVIRQPEFTYVCSEVLKTLPVRDFLSGAAELLKSFVIEDGGNYLKAAGLLSALNEADDKKVFMDRHEADLLSLIHAAAAVKAGIVSRDQFESGERRKLNLGHTFAHAIEKNARAAGDDITHGEAVAIGMAMAAELAEKKGLAAEGFASAMKTDLEKAGLPVECPYPLGQLTEAMTKDKKAEGGTVHFILPAAVGDVRVCDMTVEEAGRLYAWCGVRY